MAKEVPPVRLELNLEQIFGSKVQSRELREAIGQDVIDRITERTLRGISKTGHRFKEYSESYKNSLQFKAFGKGDNVNLKLKGDMLGQIDIVDQDSNKIVLGWRDEVQNAKAYNHTVGDTLPKRDFFGLPKYEMDAIRKKYSKEIESAKKEEEKGQEKERQAFGTIIGTEDVREILKLLERLEKSG